MSTAPDTATRYDEAAIEADPTVPMIHIWRDFTGTPAQRSEERRVVRVYRSW